MYLMTEDPLAAISGYSELIENGMVSEKDIARFGGEIHKSADRLLTLINDTIPTFGAGCHNTGCGFGDSGLVSGCRELHGYAGDKCSET